MGMKIQLLVALSSIWAASCSVHFGDVDDVRPTYEKEERNITYLFDVENHPDGGDIALFGEGFVGRRDTTKVLGENDVVETVIIQRRAKTVRLTYREESDHNYQAVAAARVKNGSQQEYSLFSPYSLVSGLPADTMLVSLSFRGSDGTSSFVRQQLGYAWARVPAACDASNPKGIVTPDSTLSLTTKYALLRLCLVDQEGRLPLAQALQMRAFSEGVACKINSIELSETESSEGFGDKVLLDLVTGATSLAPDGKYTITMSDLQGQNMIGRGLFDISADNQVTTFGSRAWGTVCYAAFPVIGEAGEASLSLQVAVHCNIGKRSVVFRGLLPAGQLYREGGNYTTTPVCCVADDSLSATTAEEASVLDLAL